MFLTDLHTHSNCSDDGFVPMHEMAAAAAKAGMDVLCLTDHCDLLSTDGQERTLTYDWAPVLQQREEMLSLWGKELTLPLGLEFGMGHLDLDAAHTILSQPQLDFVLGSIHNHSEEAGGNDFYYSTYPTIEQCYATLDDYFNSMTQLAVTDVYDSLAHIIYPLRYMERDGYTISLDRYSDQLQFIMKAVVEGGHAMEVNTYRGQTIRPWLPLLKRYRDCGGEFVTVGSDAHAPDSVGLGIRDAAALVQEAGFDYITVYRGRVPQPHKF